MKVLVACRDSGCLKEYTFSKDTDTSVSTSAKPEERIVLAAKGNPVLRFLVTPEGLVLARKNGTISLVSPEYEPLRDLGSCRDLVGLDYTDGKLVWCDKNGSGTIYTLKTEKTTPFTLPENLSVVVLHPTKPVVLCSGPQLRPELYSLEGETLFQARNPKAKLDIEERNNVTNAVFLPDPATGFAFATITSHGKVRTYNTAASKKPQQAEISKSNLRSIAVVGDKLVVGDSLAKIGLYTTANFRLLGYYKGVVGGTSHLSMRNSLVCAVGLDRYIRIYEAETRQPAGKVYTGEELDWAVILQDDDEKRELEDDNMWEDLENSRDSRAKRQKQEPESEDSQSEISEESEISEYSGSEAEFSD